MKHDDPRFPPSVTIEVDDKTPDMELLELAIDEAIKVTRFPNFKLDCIIAATMDHGITFVTYDVIKKNELDINELVYRKWRK